MKVNYKIVFWALLLGLCLPAIQKETRIFKPQKLGGYFTKPAPALFTFENWFSSGFQDQSEKYIKSKIGFRPSFIRVNNQLDYTFFKKPHAAGVILGKENFTYELGYINAYYGQDFLGYDSIQKTVGQLKEVDNKLSQTNTRLMVCIAAGKGSFYPDYFPDKLKKKKRNTTNIAAYDSLFTQEGISYINFNEWFLVMKDTSEHILYPKYGIHWSEYGMLLAMDSLIRFSGNLIGKQVNTFEITDIKKSSRYQGSDYDLGKSLNLMFPLRDQQQTYGKVKWNRATNYKPNVIVISDSFFWQMYTKGIFGESFKPGGFWYYCETLYPAKKKPRAEDVNALLAEADLIIIMATEATLNRFPFGFLRYFKD